MASADLDMLVDMGFDQERASIALKKSGSLQNAIDWLEKNQDKSLDDIKAEDASAADASPPPPGPGEEARSLKCNECGKMFRSHAQAEFHASKSGHVDFEESTEELKPLTEEEKKARLEELRQKLAEKRATQSEQDKLDKKKNDEIRRKATKEGQDAKEALQVKERIKEAEQKRREKQADIDARKRVQAQIEAQKLERKRKAEAEKAARLGQAPPEPAQEAPAATSSGPTTSKPSSAYTEARLRLQTPNGTIQKTLPVETTLFELAHQLAQESGITVNTFTQNFPKKVFDQTDFGQTLKEAGMVPSAALIVR
ncbi:Ubx domain-containing protein [Neofusicoccum parvum]|uniref:Ubx domain-containing protein n=2 Tax=Neofusicoccum parvum TaxID=310453 RepID=A0ACB5S5U2_9PEZI|nr:putative ubx domain protein [Neofusicoccum parvum UCRNP2]GME28061.1 Ubx domain-containing protein [Neofusicoccum parvum]GME63824.1 Ubx domain-containing protein [Neofusicoccum parvum]